MSKLNKIFYGPAGTGKTRQAIEEAVRIVQNSNDKHELNFSEFDTLNYKSIMRSFKSVSSLPELDISHQPLIDDIHNLNKQVDKVVGHKGYKGYLEHLDNPKNTILKYRLYPLIETVTFHPSYSYQDFVEGISVETKEGTNDIQYQVKDGIFKKICERANNNPDYNYVLIIDEINRGDISSIFGELFTLLEDGKRINHNDDNNESLSINLPYSKDEKGNPRKLTVPNNLYIVATMNTVDKSIALIDVALRRRFDFVECMPQYELEEFKSCKDIDLAKLLESLNQRITILKNEHYQIGHSYFLNIDSLEKFEEIVRKNIIPLLQEYFYDDWQSICAVLNQSYKHQNKNFLFNIQDAKTNKVIFNDEFNELIEYQNKKIFTPKQFKQNDNFDKKSFVEAIQSIYKNI